MRLIKRRKIKFDKIKGFFRRVPRFLGEHAFLGSLLLIFLALIFGTIVFYKYSILAGQRKIEISEKPLYFDEKIFEDILKILDERERKLEEAGIKKHPDLFKNPPPEELTE